ncbi:hypothetical protein NX059_001859 [Plenodomus lindquistii]|nr:hypothetical protein NX059_001859 [Plenodomus lindquistii]
MANDPWGHNERSGRSPAPGREGHRNFSDAESELNGGGRSSSRATSGYGQPSYPVHQPSYPIPQPSYPYPQPSYPFPQPSGYCQYPAFFPVPVPYMGPPAQPRHHQARNASPAKEKNARAELRFAPARYMPPRDPLTPSGGKKQFGVTQHQEKCPLCGLAWYRHRTRFIKDCRGQCRHCGTSEHLGKPCSKLYATYRWWKDTFNGDPPLHVAIRPSPEEEEILKQYNCMDEKGDWQPKEAWRVPRESKKESQVTPQAAEAKVSDDSAELAKLKARVAELEAENKRLEEDMEAKKKDAKIFGALQVFGLCTGDGIKDIELREALEGAITQAVLDGKEALC